MAIAGKWLGAHFGAELFDFDVYAICGDGDLMEGVSGEAGSIAGHQRLDNLCWIYDNNHISIDGRTELTYSDDVAARFIGYGWNVTRVGDANDLELLTRAFEVFKREEGRPTLIIVDSHIGYGSPHKQDTAEVHGEPLGDEEVRETKRAYGWPEDAEFLIPDGVYEHFADGIGARGRKLRGEWEQRVADGDPELAAQIDQMQRRELPEGWDAEIPSFDADPGGIATRKASQPGAERDRPAGAVAAQRLGGPHRLGRQRARPSTAPAPSRPRTARAASSTTGFASTSRPRSPTGWRSASCARSGRPT